MTSLASKRVGVGLVSLFLIFLPSCSASIVNLERVIAGWVVLFECVNQSINIQTFCLTFPLTSVYF